jgi:hypothetical protein
MPRSRRYGLDDGLPATLRAVRAAFTALKREFEKRGDQWVARRESAS